MSRILGINCTTNCAYLALLDGGVIHAQPDRLELPAGEESERLVGLFQDAQSVAKEQGIRQVALLLPGRGGAHQPGYFQVAPRLAIETIFRLAAATLGIPVVVLERATVRAKLKCGKDGPLEKYLDQVIPEPVGMYWNAGRGLAAMAALAAEAG